MFWGIFQKCNGWYEYCELRENSRLLLLSRKHANSFNVKYDWIKIK